VPYSPRATFENPYGPQVRFRTEDVLPPSSYYVAVDDQLVFEVDTDYAPGSFDLVVRLLNPEGVIIFETRSLTNSLASYQQKTLTMTGVEGYVLSACITASGVPAGRAFAKVTLMRSPYTTSGSTTALLAGGYVSDKLPLSYPTMQPRGPLEGPGNLVTKTTTVAPGVNWSIVCPAGVRWRINSILFRFTSSNAGTPRLVVIVGWDGAGNEIAVVPPSASQPINTYWDYHCGPGMATLQTSNLATISLPSAFIVENGGRLETFTYNLDPGDKYEQVAAQVEEWVGT